MSSFWNVTVVTWTAARKNPRGSSWEEGTLLHTHTKRTILIEWDMDDYGTSRSRFGMKERVVFSHATAKGGRGEIEGGVEPNRYGSNLERYHSHFLSNGSDTCADSWNTLMSGRTLKELKPHERPTLDKATIFFLLPHTSYPSPKTTPLVRPVVCFGVVLKYEYLNV